jgi:hypothetical protein
LGRTPFGPTKSFKILAKKTRIYGIATQGAVEEPGLPEFALGANLPGHAGDLRSEGVVLVHHPIDRVDHYFDVAGGGDFHLLRQVATGNGDFVPPDSNRLVPAYYYQW